MFGFTWTDETSKVNKKLDEALYNSMTQAGASVRLISKRSIRSSKRPSAPGSPPHTQTKALPKSILYFYDRTARTVIIGTAFNLIGLCGWLHEKGATYKNTKFDKREFMAPALEKAAPKLPNYWKIT